MIHDIFYKKELDGNYTIVIDRQVVKTSINTENGIAYLCEDVDNDLYYLDEIDYQLEIKPSNELVPLELIIDVYKDNNKKHIRSFSYMFDEYSL